MRRKRVIQDSWYSSAYTLYSRYLTEYVEIKCQLDATEVFIADLIACSTFFGHHYAHHPELKSIVQLLLPVVFCVRFAGCCSILKTTARNTTGTAQPLHNTLELRMMGIVVPETC